MSGSRWIIDYVEGTCEFCSAGAVKDTPGTVEHDGYLFCRGCFGRYCYEHGRDAEKVLMGQEICRLRALIEERS